MRTHAPKYFFNTLHENKKGTFTAQAKRKNGSWGSPIEYKFLNDDETPEMAIERLSKLNNAEFRIVK